MKISSKLYKCTRCEYETHYSTNHYGEIYPICQNCSWKNPMDPMPVWKCLEKLPQDAWIPEPWKKVKLGDLVDIKTSNKKD